MADAETVARQYFQAITDGDLDTALSKLSEDVDFQSPGGPMRGREAVRPFLGGYISGFPGSRFDISHWVSSGDTVVAEGTWSGTNSGPMLTPQGEMSATGQSVALPFVTVLEFQGDQITSHRAYWDQATFMQQLGLMPTQ